MYKFPEKKDFGNRVAKLRLDKGVSAREMSLAIGQNEGYINSIETEKNHPSMEGLSYICEYLDITPQEFFDFDTSSPKKLSKLSEKMKHLKTEQLALI